MSVLWLVSASRRNESFVGVTALIRLTDTLISLKEAALKVPGRDRKPASYETLRRWATKGHRGKRLEVLHVGGRLMTTEHALQEFFTSLGAPPVSVDSHPTYEADRAALRAEFGI
jgi:hypothetical protein